MSAIIQIDKDNWEAFLKDLAEFEKKYQLLLGKMDAVQNRLEVERGLSTQEGERRNQDISIESQRPSSESRLERASGVNGFLVHLDKKLQALNKNAPMSQARMNPTTVRFSSVRS